MHACMHIHMAGDALTPSGIRLKSCRTLSGLRVSWALLTSGCNSLFSWTRPCIICWNSTTSGAVLVLLVPPRYFSCRIFSSPDFFTGPGWGKGPQTHTSDKVAHHYFVISLTCTCVPIVLDLHLHDVDLGCVSIELSCSTKCDVDLGCVSIELSCSTQCDVDLGCVSIDLSCSTQCDVDLGCVSIDLSCSTQCDVDLGCVSIELSCSTQCDVDLGCVSIELSCSTQCDLI